MTIEFASTKWVVYELYFWLTIQMYMFWIERIEWEPVMHTGNGKEHIEAAISDRRLHLIDCSRRIEWPLAEQQRNGWLGADRCMASIGKTDVYTCGVGMVKLDMWPGS